MRVIAKDTKLDNVIVIDQIEPAASRRPRPGRHRRRRPSAPLARWGVLAMCSVTAGATAAVIVWAAEPAERTGSAELPVIITEYGGIGSAEVVAPTPPDQPEPESVDGTLPR